MFQTTPEQDFRWFFRFDYNAPTTRRDGTRGRACTCNPPLAPSNGSLRAMRAAKLRRYLRALETGKPAPKECGGSWIDVAREIGADEIRAMLALLEGTAPATAYDRRCSACRPPLPAHLRFDPPSTQPIQPTGGPCLLLPAC